VRRHESCRPMVFMNGTDRKPSTSLYGVMRTVGPTE
jgi:hypothetical protein